MGMQQAPSGGGRTIVTVGLVEPAPEDPRTEQVWERVAGAMAAGAFRNVFDEDLTPLAVERPLFPRPHPLANFGIVTLLGDVRAWECEAPPSTTTVNEALQLLRQELSELIAANVTLLAAITSVGDHDAAVAFAEEFGERVDSVRESAPRGVIPFGSSCPATRIYVGNLPSTTSAQDLTRWFSRFGPVVDVSLVTDRDTGHPRGFGYIEMNEPEARLAIEALHGAPVDDRSIVVDEVPAVPRHRDRELAAPPRFGFDPPAPSPTPAPAPPAPPPPEDAGSDGPADDDVTDEELLELVESEARPLLDAYEYEEAADEAAAPDDTDEPPRVAHARVECPHEVVVETPFTLIVGLAKTPTPGTISGPMPLPDATHGAYTLDVRILAHGFTPGDGALLHHALPVTAAAPHPSVTLPLTALRDPVLVAARQIQVVYAVDGQVIGVAVRPVQVVEQSDDLGDTPAPTGGGRITVPTAAEPADLTVTIGVGAAGPGSLQWSMVSPHDDLPLPADAVPSLILGSLDDFTKGLIRKVAAAEQKASLPKLLVGMGQAIARAMPAEVRAALEAVCARAHASGRTASILLLTAEPNVPWELASLAHAPDATAASFLGAQADVGRWIFGNLEPDQPPTGPLRGTEIGVVTGDYSNVPKWNRLEQAEQEAAHLVATYGATSLEAVEDSVLALLDGDPPCDVLHFAMHGSYDPQGIQDGLVLADGSMLDPLVVEASRLARHPFVYLNACQASGGQQLLGAYAGMAASFLYAGASAVVAPVWSVGDVIAREIATRFYERVLRGARPADLLRQERAGFDQDSRSATHLAYQFFGHPHFRAVPEGSAPPGAATSPGAHGASGLADDSDEP